MHSIKPYKKVQGFTLIEIMVVVVILGILGALIVPQIMKRPEQARMVKAKQDILAIQSSLELYRMDNGFYPSTEQGLNALVKEPETDPRPLEWQSYLKKLPIDPWGQTYQYKNPGEHGEIDIYSFGPKTKKLEENGHLIGNWDDSDKKNVS